MLLFAFQISRKAETMLQTLTPKEFAAVLEHESRPILAGCLEPGPLYAEQLKVLEEVALTCAKQFSVCLMSPDYCSEFSRTYAIAGTPSYLFFYQGVEKTRFLGHADAINLMSILLVDGHSEPDAEPVFDTMDNTIHLPNISGLFHDWKRH